MSQPFLITGLPRCRTAWMASLAASDQSTCVHEPLKHMAHWRDIFALWNDGKTEFTGVSDSAMGFHLGEILDRAAPRTLIIWRAVPDVEQSLVRQGFQITSDYCDVLSRRMDVFRGHPLVASVGFDSLRDPEVVAGCLQHLMPGAPLDMDRIDDMMDVVIQVDPYEIMASAQARAGDIHNLLGEDVIAEMQRR